MKTFQLCILSLPHQGHGTWGPGGAGMLQSPIAHRKANSIDIIFRAELTRICQRTLGPVAYPKGCPQRERKQRVEENRETVPKVCLCQLFLFPTSPPCPLCQNYISSHVCYQKNDLVPWFLSLSVGWELLQNEKHIPSAAPLWPTSFSRAVHLVLTSQLR